MPTDAERDPGQKLRFFLRDERRHGGPGRTPDYRIASRLPCRMTRAVKLDTTFAHDVADGNGSTPLAVPKDAPPRTDFMRFHSVLFARPDDATTQGTREAPVFFHDLNLAQIVQAITAGWTDYDLVPFFHVSLNDLDAVAYRQEVMRDLEGKAVMQAVNRSRNGCARCASISSWPTRAITGTKSTAGS